MKASGAKHYKWVGGRRINSGGYVILAMGHGQPRREHVVIVERAIGKPLNSRKHPIHHWNENPSDNKNSNLVVCEDPAYHRLLHVRMRAYRACGNPDYRQCFVCKEYGDPEEMIVWKTTFRFAHVPCSRKKALKDKWAHRERKK